jgi:hypothetical protein
MISLREWAGLWMSVTPPPAPHGFWLLRGMVMHPAGFDILAAPRPPANDDQPAAKA